MLALGLLVRHYVAGMDERFFLPSVDGAHGLVRYTLGHNGKWLVRVYH